MKLPIELIVFFMFVFVIIAWLFLSFITRKWLEWRYNKEHDKSRKSDGGTPKTTADFTGQGKPKERPTVQTTAPIVVRKNRSSFRTTLTR